MLTEIPAEQFATALDTCAEEVLREADALAPPVDALHVARQMGIEIAHDKPMDVRARFVRLGGAGEGTILLAEDPRPERLQWAVAHEIGESTAQRAFELLGVALADIPPGGRESVANRLARCLLLPRVWFATDGPALDWDLHGLKEIYRTASHELIARRMLDMAPPAMVTLFDQGRLQWRKSNLPGSTPPLLPHEKKTWRRTFDSGRASACDDSELPDGIADIRCWPVHEPGWRREILRTALEVW